MQYREWYLKLYNISEIVLQLLLLNFLWIIFTLVGFGILGIFPATTAVFSVIRKWINGERSIPLFKSYWYFYKNDFVQSNILGYTFVILGLIIYVDWYFFSQSQNILAQMLSFVFFALIILYLIALLYIIPIYVTYDLKYVEYIKYSFLLPISKPLHAVGYALVFLLIFAAIRFIPFVLFFFGMSIIGIVMMKITTRIFTITNNI